MKNNDKQEIEEALNPLTSKLTANTKNLIARDKATQKLTALIEAIVIEARIDELCELTDKGFDIEANCREWAWTINQYTQKRLSKLKAQTVRGEK